MNYILNSHYFEDLTNSTDHILVEIAWDQSINPVRWVLFNVNECFNRFIKHGQYISRAAGGSN